MAADLPARPYLRKIAIDRSRLPDPDVFPFALPVFAALESMSFHADVTFIIGENGSGKSTLIEGLAQSLGFWREGGTKSVMLATADDLSPLGQCIRLERSYMRPRDAFFLRAESFYNVATYMDSIPEASYRESYGGFLHQRSHGELFFNILTKKLKGSGLYLFDEPESALSPMRQMAALGAIHNLVRKESQFIIATHSPILMAYPNAKILQFTGEDIAEIDYEETEHYTVTRDFLNRHRKLTASVLGELDLNE